MSDSLSYDEVRYGPEGPAVDQSNTAGNSNQVRSAAAPPYERVGSNLSTSPASDAQRASNQPVKVSHDGEPTALSGADSHLLPVEETSNRWRALLYRDVPKRLVDIVGATIAILALAPVFLLIAIAIVTTSRGPALYSQARLGHGGRVFRCWKFRTMFHDAEQRLSNLLRSNSRLAAEYAEFHKLRVDPRVTSIGKLLRRTSLDELPQLWNVLIGEMSLVGPRPIIDDEAGRAPFGRSLPAVLSVRPGMTGLWQVSGRCNLSHEARVALDTHYTKTHSVWGDALIMLRTIWVVVRGVGAY